MSNEKLRMMQKRMRHRTSSELQAQKETMSLGADRMAIWKLAIGTTFLLQTGVGVLGNFSLLCHYLYLYCTKCRFRPTDRILQHLTVANCFVTLSKGVPETLAAFGLTHFLGDLGCKLVFYLHRVGRDVSMGTTCLLGVFQLVTISPRSSRWPGLKVKAPRYLGTSSILCWVLNLGLNITVFMNMTGRRSNQNSSKEMDLGYCYAVLQEKITSALYVPLLTSRDAVCMGVMLWASGSTVLTLHRHKQRVRHIHRNFRPTYETVASQEGN
ncbi:vomeronasal type-1 receptor 4-like [Tupaia chinensis]|uniref:vomeronasal type-1 receptor 4-like n=1 Tax=Tupaia chinensis TaxID=246437 RepID=UPI0003C8E2D1|nr:vomeronasal type-1 receptor 4-like [Tupaia chinensis]